MLLTEEMLLKPTNCEMLNQQNVIYKFEHLSEHKIYIGKTKRKLITRIKEHVKPQKKGSYIESAIQQHGIESFDVAVVEECANPNELNEREIFWIKFFNCKAPNGYNLTDGGDGGSGHIVTEETRLKISKTKTGKPGHPNSEKQRKIASELCKKRKGLPRKPLTLEHRQNISKGGKGRIFSAETRAKLVAVNKNRRSVRCLETGEIFKSLTTAGEWAGVTGGTILAACKKSTRTGGGYHWEYLS